MTNKEAVETLKIAIAEVEWNYTMDYDIAFEKALEALEKQVPKKIIETDWIYCPNCEISLDPVQREKYCVICGQALDWGEAE